MKRFVLILLILAATPALAFWHGSSTGGGGGGGTVNCGLHTGFPALDGCSGAGTTTGSPTISALTYQNPNAFTDGTLINTATPGVTKARSSRITWSVAGVDFPTGIKTTGRCGSVGYCSGATGLIDMNAYLLANTDTSSPRKLTADPAGLGCTLTTSTYNTTTGAFKCIVANGSSANIAFDQFDFTPDASGLCVSLLVQEQTFNNAGNGGTVSFTNNRFIIHNHVTCLQATSPGGFLVASPIMFFSNSTPGTESLYNISVKNNRFDGAADQNYQLVTNGDGDNYKTAGGLGPMQVNGFVGFSSGGTFTAQYNHLTNIAQTSFYGLQNACGLMNLSYNTDYNRSTYAGYGHGDFTLQQLTATACPSGPDGMKQYNNTIWNDQTQKAGNGSSYLVGSYTITTTNKLDDFQLNTLSANKLPFVYMPNNGWVVSTPGTAGNVNDILTINDNVCNPHPRIRISVDASTTTAPYDGGQCPSSPAIGSGNTWTTTCTGTKCGPPNTESGMVVYFNASFGNFPQAYLIWITSGGASTMTLTSGIVKNNALLADGALSNAINITNQVTCTNPIDFGTTGVSDNFRIYDGANVPPTTTGAVGC